MKFSFSTVAWRHKKINLEDMIYIISLLGYDGIEIWEKHLYGYETSLDSIKKQLSYCRLEVPMIVPYFDFTSSLKKWKQSIIAAERSIQFANALNCKLIRCFTGRIGSDHVTEKQRAACVDGIRIIAEKAKEYKLSLAIETHVNTLVDSIGATKQLIEDINMSNVALNLDFFNLFEIEDKINLLELIDELYPYIFHIHVKNALKKSGILSPFNFIMDRTRKINEIRNLKDGILDYDEVISHLIDHNYQRFVSIECFEFNRNPIRIAKEEIAYLSALRSTYIK
jgi:sugar phosphate isomerase/epimerase